MNQAFKDSTPRQRDDLRATKVGPAGHPGVHSGMGAYLWIAQ
jgi:hypothetical protein